MIYLCCVSKKNSIELTFFLQVSSSWDWRLHLCEDSKIILFKKDKVQQASACVQFYHTVSFCVTCYFDLTLLCGCKSQRIFCYIKMIRNVDYDVLKQKLTEKQRNTFINLFMSLLLFCFGLEFEMTSLCSIGWPRTHNAEQAGLKLIKVCFPLPSKWWHYRSRLPCHLYVFHRCVFAWEI